MSPFSKGSSGLQAVPGIASLVFILGHPLEHTLSPVMQNAAFRKIRLPWLYVPFDLLPEQLATAMEVLRATHVRGANVTVPHKESVISRLDWVEPEARWLGSVNTIFRKGNKLCGTSTDGEGFLRSLGPWRKKLKGSQGLLIGAGGAAKAVAGALLRSGIKRCDIVNRSPQKAVRLVRVLRRKAALIDANAVSLAEAEKNLAQYDWIVQATSIGLKKSDPSPISFKMAKPSTWVVDLIYHRNTTFLQEAQNKGLPGFGGLGMLLHQGALSFETWSGKQAPLSTMRRALLRGLAQH